MLDHKEFVVGLEDLKNLRGKKAALEKETTETTDAIEKLVYDLVEYMETTGVESIKLDDLGMCVLTRTKKYSVEDPVSFERWMVEHGERENVMAVHAQKVHGYYKEKLENNEELPPGIRTFIKSNVTIRS